jgi:hypothetical protein
MAEFEWAVRALDLERNSAAKTATPNHPRLSAAPANYDWIAPAPMTEDA